MEVVPRDGESQYMLAVAFARDGQPDRAIASVKKALNLGIPASRFIGGTKTGLENLRGIAAFEALFTEYSSELVHGPMLGQNTGTSISIWVRTRRASEVEVQVRKEGAGW